MERALAGVDPVTILCAGPGLGFYVPGALLARQIGRRRPVDLVVIEALLPAAHQATVRRARVDFHRDFRVAKMGQRVVKDFTADLDPSAVEALRRRWTDEGRRDFIVFSGFWAPLLSRHAREAGPLRIDLCHVDAAASSSWSLAGADGRPPGARDVWFVEWEERRLGLRLEVSGEPPLPWSERGDRLLAHGGGWGMGTYRERIRAVDSRQWPLDLLCYEQGDIDRSAAGVRHLLLDPGWSPWEVKGPADWFPPLGEIDSIGAVRYSRSADFPPLFSWIRRAPAVITKPGGGTLIDSLAAATPLLLVEPFGDYERKNGLLWKQLGFALDLDEWVAGGCRREALEPLHGNLLAARARTPDYSTLYCEYCEAAR
jgi:hypothetical protein